MKVLLHDLFAHHRLDRTRAEEVLRSLADGAYNDAEIAAFLTVYLMRPIALAELQGFRDALLACCIPIDLGDVDAIDLCGTGGDGKHTFNVSTLAAFVVAGAGYPVVKHGNYGVSSLCGSSNVLEALGYTFTRDEAALRRHLRQAGICFLHAPLFHPALGRVAPVRRQLGVKTFFNMLGPLVNPARPRRQLVGVFSLELARLYQYLLEEAGSSFCIVHSLDGYDELSLTGPARIIRPEGPQMVEPADLGLPRLRPEDLSAEGGIAEAAAIFREVLAGQGPEKRHQVVLANAALAIGCYHPGRPFARNLEEARASLYGGRGAAALERLLALSAEDSVSKSPATAPLTAPATTSAISAATSPSSTPSA
ncbi:MAG: anthranilate phosphoribosyltransferase [Bacteroidetes bacterium]|nr:anthranilate phosphoribosyltransferase [Bacteroidota bacterium]